MIVIVGVSHHTAPIEVREQVAVLGDDAPGLLKSLTSRSHVSEALVVSTCNRLELVATGPGLCETVMVHDVAVAEAVEKTLTEALIARAPHIGPHLYCHVGASAVAHLFRVASSLDSLVVGEPQILGQVKAAYALARETGTVGGTLERTVNGALRAAKRVRTETAIGAGQVSVPSVAVDLARQIFGDLKGVTTLLVGSGDVAETVARLMGAAGASLLVTGRNPERVSELVRAVGGEGRPWSELDRSVSVADLVISSTGAPGIIIPKEMVARARKARRGKNQLLIDLALPRDIASEVDGLDGVFLYNVDHLAEVVGSTAAIRGKDADLAERIVQAEAETFARRSQAEQATPTIVALRSQLDAVLKEELSQSLNTKLKHLGEDERRALERMLDAALNKMLHAPTTRLRHVASQGSEESAELRQLTHSLHELFGLGRPDKQGRASGAPASDSVALDASGAGADFGEPPIREADEPGDPELPRRRGGGSR